MPKADSERCSSTEPLIYRPLTLSDYHHGFLSCLTNLTQVGEITFEQFRLQFERRSNCHTFVAEDPCRGIVVGTATLVIEYKFVHGCGIIGHIEDVAVSGEYSGRGIGLALIEQLKELAVKAGCYKVILDCGTHNVKFYERCDMFHSGEVQMRWNCPPRGAVEANATPDPEMPAKELPTPKL